ncbi:hypothetical protein HJC23_005679 [Cyclotella cryptica]|uniref:Leucine-rich repeat-containing N-terminal plant-type domain-containing protein n=1 Tax=Cyclotella cryptica TaxID=29204 RepID=A0ABD3PHL4_9STRA|eukprot:CCRYP_015530-RA/>CCRYP_015530-RA protein AED:0.05 eAED:0.05 QI:256/1/1/1/0.85/0.75/8/130/1936
MATFTLFIYTIFAFHCKYCVGTWPAHSIFSQTTRLLLNDSQSIELQILTALYQSTSGSTWTVSTSWLGDASHCTWFGITCTDEDYVSKIELSNNNLKGSVPLRALLRMPFLKVLRLDGNSIDSNVGDGVDIALWEGVLFDDLSSFSSVSSVTSSLQYIDLSNTDVLSGQLSTLYSPSYIINPDQSASPIIEKAVSYPFLNDLYLSGCSIQSSLAEKEWSVFGSLERWVLDDNMMRGSIPTNIQMNNLRVFSASGNQLIGELEGFGRLEKLRHLSLRGNQFYGSIPQGLRCDGSGVAKLLEILDLSSQSGLNKDGSIGLTGELPSFSQCDNLRRLDLSRNSIGGTVPTNFLKSADPLVFEGAMLNSNRIEGTLPSTLVRFDSDAIAIQDNMITGLDEKELCDSSRSGAIAAFGCDAVLCPPGKYYPGTGRQEEAGEECRSCEGTKYWGAIMCSNESLLSGSGPSPSPVKQSSIDEEAITEDDQKTILMQLYENTEGQSWKNNNGWIMHETISVCDWYGVDCALGTKLVESLDLRSNNLKGRVSKSLFQLTLLKTLVLKDNDLFSTKADSVDFFSEIHKAINLEVLDLSSTGLSAVLGLENAPALTELYLDSNPFDGSTIPVEIFSLKKLKMLTMDDCGLSGAIDNSIHLLSDLVLLSASNNRLGGNLPPEFSYLTSLSTLRLKNNNIVGTIPSSFNMLASLTSLDLSGQKSAESIGLEGPLREFAESPFLTRIDLSTNSLSGPVPGFFLAAVDPETFEYADLSDNLLVSSFPIGLRTIATKVYLQQNHISSIQEICDVALEGTDVEELGCDGILCAPGTYNSLGRATSHDPCVKCNESSGVQYFGSVSCGTEKSQMSEKDAIELIYSSCNGPNWLSRTSWLLDSVSVCKWEGITCSDDGTVTDISLRSNGLSGTFPLKEVFEALPGLNSLALEGNDVSFDFTQVEGSPALVSLDVTNTKTESLDGIENLNKLLELYASSNDLRGDFPKKVLQLSYLERLDLSFNNFDGTLPSEIGFALKKMILLSLHHNSFSGELPTSIGEMSALQYLQMQSNQFTGEIPPEVSGLTGLRDIDLSDQISLGGGLTGTLPSFAKLSLLQSLDLSHNKLLSTVPSDLLATVDTNEFIKLDLSSNSLKGELPASLSRLPLINLDFSDNQITGVAAGMCGDDCAKVLCAPTTYSQSGRQESDNEYCAHCPRAVYWGTTFCPGTTPTKQPISMSAGAASAGISLSENDVDKLKLIYQSCGGEDWFHNDNWMSSESICTWYGIECNDENSVKSIVLSGNNLKGVFPPNIFFLPNLETLALDSNDLRFSFSSIKYAIKLTSCDLSDTGLFKLDGIQNAPALLSLDISRNDFRGDIPLEVFQISTLQQLFMGSNAFRSSIPSNIGDLKELKLLSCSSSNLQGSIPKSFGELKNLVHLNLEDNDLTGTLPSEIGTLESLTFLDLSSQSLRGHLLSFEALRDLRRLDLSSNLFSGTVPAEFLSGVNPLFFDYLDLSQNFLTGEVPSILSHFDTIYLQENQFSTIDSELCDRSRGGVFKQFGCDAILCPSGTYNAIGRQDSEVNGCEICPGSLYLGATSCNSTESQIPVEALELLPYDIVQESEALSKFYHQCGGDYWNSNNHWMDNRLSHCRWQGIECHNGTKTVKSINLGSNNILGTPPQELFQLLPNLNNLHLNSNPLSSFNFHWLEDSLRLTDLNLDAVGLTAVDGIASAPSLRRLSLRSNRLSGPFPDELLEIKTLTSLIIGHNDFTGPIPRFEKLPYLETLIINDNQFTGNLDDINFPRTIKLLDMSHNQLSGLIPSSFLENVPVSRQVEVDLSDNQLTSIDSLVCSNSNWNRGDVEKYGCNGLLCPIRYYSNTGRQSSLGGCVHCPSASYLGSTECPDVSGPGAALWVPLVIGFVVILGLFLVVAKRIKRSREQFEEQEEAEALEPDACIT